MPGHDGTGPFGAGSMTGRGRGYCIMKLPENGRLPEIVSEVLFYINESVSPDTSSDDSAQVRMMISKMQSALINLDRRIEILITNRRKNK